MILDFYLTLMLVLNSLQMIADVFASSCSFSDLNIKCQLVVDKISDWPTSNRLNLNYDKTCYMVFTPSNNDTVSLLLNLTLNSKKINKVSSIKYLGVIIDENLDWKPHIQSLRLCLRKYVGIFFTSLA